LKNNVYKIFTEEDWNLFQESGRFSGSPDDIRGGYIHLSTRVQLPKVIEKFFAGKGPLHVAEFSVLDFHSRLKWETSVSG